MAAHDAELARLNSTARRAFDRGSLPLAVNLYQQALTRARALDDANDIGDAAYNLAVCRIALGEYEPARELLSEAETELARARADLADVLQLEAKLAHWQGRREDSLRFTERVLAHPASRPSPAHRAEVALLKGHLACDNRDAAGARKELDEANRRIPATGGVALRAGSERLSGAILVLKKKSGEAALAFDREAAFCQQARQSCEMADALMRAGEAWRDAGQPATAAERFFRAARGFHAQGDLFGGRQSAMVQVLLRG